MLCHLVGVNLRSRGAGVRREGAGAPRVTQRESDHYENGQTYTEGAGRH